MKCESIFEPVAIDSFTHKVGANTGIYQAKVQVLNDEGVVLAETRQNR
jgi:hypothetical protein